MPYPVSSCRSHVSMGGASAPEPVTDVFTTTDIWHSPVGGVVGGTAIVECWGAGAGGGTSDGLTVGAGAGGGGAYATASVSIAPNTDYNFTIGQASLADNMGDDSFFDDGSLVKARGGGKASGVTGGLGGEVVAGTGHVGGDGGSVGVAAAGGGAGGGAGTLNDGTNGTDASGVTKGTGGAGGTIGGGVGGDGANVPTGAQNGQTLGGGGGGGSVARPAGGTGARGEGRITYTPL